MRFIFVLSASIWAWLVGRCIAFGPKSQAICWRPNLHADTWYRLTHIPIKIPYKWFKYMPLGVAAASITPLYIKNDFIHIATVLTLVSEHTYIPIFVAHVHSKATLASWALINAAANVFIIYLLNSWILAITIIGKIGIHTWFFIIESYMIINRTNIERQVPSYDGRQSRVITV